jgi:hypothetical protein
MALKARSPGTIAAHLIVSERVLLFCLASGTDWAQAGVTQSTARHLMIKNLFGNVVQWDLLVGGSNGSFFTFNNPSLGFRDGSSSRKN